MESSSSWTTPEQDTCDETDEEKDWDLCVTPSNTTRLSVSPSEAFWSQTIPTPLKKRMENTIYKYGKRCLVENTASGNALHYVHCLTRRLKSRKVNGLEYRWGMQRGTLNLDTRSNVFCLSAKFKALWEAKKWFLLPEADIMKQYHDAALHDQDPPDVGEGPFRYRLIAHPDMKSVVIHRQIAFPNLETESLKPEHFLFSTFPYDNLGTITSHLHPKFVIGRIALIHDQRGGAVTIVKYHRAHPDILKPLRMCQQIFGRWGYYLQQHVSEHRAFLKNKIKPEDVFSDTSDRTANRRLEPHMGEKRLVKERDYVYVKEDDGVKLKRKADAAHLVTAKKLRKLEEHLNSRQISKRKWKAIQSWRSSISEDGHPDKELFDPTSEESIVCAIAHTNSP